MPGGGACLPAWPYLEDGRDDHWAGRGGHLPAGRISEGGGPWGGRGSLDMEAHHLREEL